MPNETLTTPQKVLDYIKRTGVLIETAEKEATVKSTKEAAVAALIPDVVDALVQHGRIEESLREKAAEQLKDPVRTLEILASVAAHRTDSEKAHLGSPAGIKSASVKYNSYVGARPSGDEERASDIAILEKLGIR